MERLTERLCKGMVRIKGCSTAYPDKERKGAPMASTIARLADYEDIGTQEEINRIIDAYGRGLTLRTDAGERLEIVKDIQTERLKELAQAENDGRLVVLPEVQERDRKSFVDGLHDYFQEASFCDPSTGIFGMSEGEKELASALMNALTCEEAEAALKKREADNEVD